MHREGGAAMAAVPPAPTMVNPENYGVHGADVGMLAAGVVADASARAVRVERTLCPFTEAAKEQFFAAVPPLSLRETCETWSTRVYDALQIANGLLAAVPGP